MPCTSFGNEWPVECASPKKAAASAVRGTGIGPRRQDRTPRVTLCYSFYKSFARNAGLERTYRIRGARRVPRACHRSVRVKRDIKFNTRVTAATVVRGRSVLRGNRSERPRRPDFLWTAVGILPRCRSTFPTFGTERSFEGEGTTTGAGRARGAWTSPESEWSHHGDRIYRLQTIPVIDKEAQHLYVLPAQPRSSRLPQRSRARRPSVSRTDTKANYDEVWRTAQGRRAAFRGLRIRSPTSRTRDATGSAASVSTVVGRWRGFKLSSGTPRPSSSIGGPTTSRLSHSARRFARGLTLRHRGEAATRGYPFGARRPIVDKDDLGSTTATTSPGQTSGTFPIIQASLPAGIGGGGPL